MSRLNKFRIYAISVILILVSVCMMIMGVMNSSTKPENIYDVSYDEIQTGKVYYVPELCVVDIFAEMEQSSTRYFLALFLDENDELVAVDLAVNKSDDVYSKLLAYANDASQQVGDCLLDCYVKVQRDAASDADSTRKLHEFYDEAIDTYEEVMGMSFQRSGVRFTYCCDGSQNPETVLGKQAALQFLSSLILLIVGILILLLMRKNAAKELQPSPAPAANVPAADDSQAANLKSLLDAGMLTQEEYSRKIAELSSQK